MLGLRRQRALGGAVEADHGHARAGIHLGGLDHVLGRAAYAVLGTEEAHQLNRGLGPQQIGQVPQLAIHGSGVADDAQPQPSKRLETIRLQPLEPGLHHPDILEVLRVEART